MAYTDQQRQQIANEEYSSYVPGDPVKIGTCKNDQTTVGYVAQAIQMPGGLDGCAPANRKDEDHTRRITFSANPKNTLLR